MGIVLQHSSISYVNSSRRGLGSSTWVWGRGWGGGDQSSAGQCAAQRSAQCRAVPVQGSAVQGSASTVQGSVHAIEQCNAGQGSAMQCSAVHHPSRRRPMLQHGQRLRQRAAGIGERAANRSEGGGTGASGCGTRCGCGTRYLHPTYWRQNRTGIGVPSGEKWLPVCYGRGRTTCEAS